MYIVVSYLVMPNIKQRLKIQNSMGFIYLSFSINCIILLNHSTCIIISWLYFFQNDTVSWRVHAENIKLSLQLSSEVFLLETLELSLQSHVWIYSLFITSKKWPHNLNLKFIWGFQDYFLINLVSSFYFFLMFLM